MRTDKRMKLTKEASKQKRSLTYPSLHSGFSSDRTHLSPFTNSTVSAASARQGFTTLILTRSTLSLVVQGSNGLVSKSRAINLDKGRNMAHVVSVSMPNMQAGLWESQEERLPQRREFTEFVFKGNNQHPGTAKCGYLPFKLTQPDHC